MKKNKLRNAAVLIAFVIIASVNFAQGQSGKVTFPRFTPSNAAILLVDHQDLTVSWIYSQDKKSVVNNVRMLGRLGNDMNIPLLITSTMEDKIGTNIKDVQQVAPKAYASRIKRGGTLNCFDDVNFKAAVKALGKKNLIIAGLTTDICLLHTVEGAIREGYTVQVVADACGSANMLTDQITFDKLRDLGVVITGANSILTELYTDFGTTDGQKAAQINMEEVVSKYGKP